MQKPSLRQLDKRTIAVELTLPDRKQVFKGIGRFDSRAKWGPALCVGIDDPTGPFEIVLKESEWNGQIGSGERFDCDFAVQLDASCLCTH
jgi:hypothetical protein